MNNDKQGLQSFIIGLVFTIINCGILALAFTGSRFPIGTFLIIFPIFGVIKGIGAFRTDGVSRILGIIGLALNVIAGLESLAIGGLIILSRIMA